ncbi:MAG: ATP synthase F1 subunit delta [Nitrospiraceae bacterium]|nr:ATP synthase F1 subunit delta [Nitrospiraceae bacterium]
MITIVAKRYAKALVELSQEKNLVEKTRTDLSSFAAAVDGQEQLQKLFASPAFTPEAKKKVIGELAAKLGMQKTTTRFIEHLAETGRIRYFRDVQQAFEGLLADRENRARAQVTTAAAMGAGELADIKKKLEAVTGKQVEVDAKVDPAVIGGARAQVGSVVYDGTIRNQLNKMRDRLVR